MAEFLDIWNERKASYNLTDTVNLSNIHKQQLRPARRDRQNSMAKIDIVSSCLVRMATSAHPTDVPPTLELTPWDLKYLPLDPIQKGILFYKPDQSQTLVDHLKQSLSRTLDFFPPLSGRLGTVENDDKTVSYFIDCNDAGAEFTHAVAGDMFVSDIVEPKYIPGIVSSFFPLNDSKNHEGLFKPLLGVKVTELADGFFIACSANHAVVDGTSFWHFMNSWSEISCGADRVTKAPVFERWFPSSFSGERRVRLTPFIQNPSNKFAPPSLLERVFRFSKESLAKLKAQANYEAGSNNISTLQALSAHLWRGVLRGRRQQNKSDNFSEEEIYFHLLVGARARIPLKDGYFGNAAYADKMAAKEQEVLQNGLGFAAQKINELVLRQTAEAAIKLVEDWLKAPTMLSMGDIKFVISSSPRHNVYGCDYGWGKPIAVRSGKGQKFDGKMTLFPAPEPGGIDVEVCVATETLKEMESDEEFMEAVTII